MKKHLHHFFLVLSFVCVPHFLNAQAQCNVHGVDGGDAPAFQTSGQAGFILGQSFEACQTGEITSIAIRAASDAIVGTQSLRIGTSDAPPTSTLGGGVYQTFTNNGGEETIIIDLDIPFSVTDGNVYAFEIEIDTGFDMSIDSDDDYDGGISYFDTGGFAAIPEADLDFDVVISEAAEVPTVSEWGFIILALLLLTFGILYLVQPQFGGHQLSSQLEK